jgi:hypothetical protein
MEIDRSHSFMMSRGMFLGEVVSMISGSGGPIDMKLALLYPISHPIKTHIHCFGLLLFDCIVDNAVGCSVVGLNRGGGLGMIHLFKSSS